MKNKYILIFFVFIVNSIAIKLQAQDIGIQSWKVSKQPIQSITDTIERKNLPKKYKLVILNFEEFKTNFKSKQLQKGSIISFPNEKGVLQKYKVFESSILAPQLQHKYPNIATFVGKAVNNPTNIIRFSVTKKGFYAMVLRQGKPTLFIDPFSKNLATYIVYSKQELPIVNNSIKCSVKEKANNSTLLSKPVKVTNISDGKLRTYRLAIATTGEYSQYHLTGTETNDAEKKETVLSAIVTTVSRANGIFERDLALKLLLVPNNTAIIYLNKTTDPFTNNNASTLIEQSQTVIDATIGFDNYDIGHTFSTSAGGLAELNSFCTTNKAKGVTGTGKPIGDAYDIDYVVHEMGHQFGASHTFNSVAGSCGNGTERNPSTAVEPGSGSTIMAYAGICAPENVQSSGSSYFHAVSIAEIWANISEGSRSNCPTITALNNNVPTSNAGNNYTIPKATPFVLTGIGNDSDGDEISYCWEQIDAKATSEPLSSTITNGPAYRSIPPTTSPKRYFPNFETVLNGNLYNNWEVTPSVGRTVNFALTVRDNNPLGGQLTKSEMTVTVNGASGPFEVVSQNSTGITWQSGTFETITWNVANTNRSPINCSLVNIVLSIDGGKTYPITLASNTPNDGSESILVPNNPSPYCRIMILPINNIFYSINKQNFGIDYTVSKKCTTYNSISNNIIPDKGAWVVNTIDIADNMKISDLNVGINITHANIGDLSIKLVNTNSATNQTIYNYSCGNSDNMNLIFDDQAATLNCANLTTGSHAPVNPLSIFNGEMSQGTWQLQVADSYAGDQGVLNNWSIEVCTINEIPLEIHNSESSKFTIYPNPSNGKFTINLASKNTTKNVNVQLYDVTGRMVLYKNYKQNNLNFSKEIDASQISSGIYIIKVQKGNESISKQLIIYK